MGSSSPQGSASASRRHRVVPPDMGAAWLLDVKSFHQEFDDLFARLGDPGGYDRFLGRALRVCADPDPVVRHYLSTLAVHSPEQWARGFDPDHLGEWYRVLMAPHLTRTTAVESPTAVRDRLPDLGWAAADARRLAFGRELASLAAAHGDPDAAALRDVLPLGNKGWLSQADIAGYTEALRALEPDRFRDHQPLVPLVEEVFAVLQAATLPERVLLLPPA